MNEKYIYQVQMFAAPMTFKKDQGKTHEYKLV